MLLFIYHKDYSKYNLGEDHPFLSLKPKNLLEFLKSKTLSKRLEVLEPKLLPENELYKVHTKDFVNLVKALSESGGLLSLDTPAPKGIYEIARLACSGTKLIAEKVVTEDFWCGINTLGGFHHAAKDKASGFCFFNDFAIGIEFLRSKYKLKKFLVVDTDVHHGNGTQEIYYNDPSVLHISLHQDGRTLYPGTGFVQEIGTKDALGYTVNIPLPPGISDKSYLYIFDLFVPKLANLFQPEIIFWQSGVDTYHRDPLANLNLTLNCYYLLGLRMKAIAENTCNKLVIGLGGGYDSEGCTKGYYNIISALLGNHNFIKEDFSFSENLKSIKELAKTLRLNLSNYWDL
jgi:acetoin utilization deacetylase AcuC-like enzyme